MPAANYSLSVPGGRGAQLKDSDKAMVGTPKEVLPPVRDAQSTARPCRRRARLADLDSAGLPLCAPFNSPLGAKRLSGLQNLFRTAQWQCPLRPRQTASHVPRPEPVQARRALAASRARATLRSPTLSRTWRLARHQRPRRPESDCAHIENLVLSPSTLMSATRSSNSAPLIKGSRLASGSMTGTAGDFSAFFVRVTWHKKRAARKRPMLLIPGPAPL
jgi:hypothetical protein